MAYILAWNGDTVEHSIVYRGVRTVTTAVHPLRFTRRTWPPNPIQSLHGIGFQLLSTFVGEYMCLVAWLPGCLTRLKSRPETARETRKVQEQDEWLFSRVVVQNGRISLYVTAVHAIFFSMLPGS